MADYFNTPFPFSQIIKKSGSSSDGKKPDTLSKLKLNLEDSIRSNIRSLVLMRKGEFFFDRNVGFDIWDYDKEVFYHKKEPYFESANSRKKGALETNASAKKYFKSQLRDLITENEIRLIVTSVDFGFEQVDGNFSVYQRKIVIEVNGKIKNTGENLSPPFKMSILYTPFKVDSN